MKTGLADAPADSLCGLRPVIIPWLNNGVSLWKRRGRRRSPTHYCAAVVSIRFVVIKCFEIQ